MPRGVAERREPARLDDVEARVLALVSARDSAAAATLALRAHGPAVLLHLASLLRDRDDAWDAYSLFAESVWRGLPSFRAECPLVRWLHRVARNAALRVGTDRWRRSRCALACACAEAVREDRRAEDAGTLAALRAALPLRDRTLLALRLDAHLPWPEVAAALSLEVPVRTEACRKRYERIKARLARLARAGEVAGRGPAAARTWPPRPGWASMTS